jgi:hypothetical protein
MVVKVYLLSFGNCDNYFALGSFPQSSQPGQQLPFVNSANPVMSLVSGCTLCVVVCKFIELLNSLLGVKNLNAFD